MPDRNRRETTPHGSLFHEASEVEHVTLKPRLLDLFCGAGGCTKGYQDAGFYVVGVDINPQPRYCGDEFVHTGNQRRTTPRGALFDALSKVMSPGEDISYTEALERLYTVHFNTAGVGMKFHDIAFRGHTQTWRGSEFVTYRIPYFAREAEGDWTEGELRIVRRESEPDGS